MSPAARLQVSAVDYHTAGEPFRIVSGGVPALKGANMLEKRRYAQEHLDHVRRLLVNEPRGHADMYGCFVTEPDDEKADLAVVFFHNAGYSTACGHGTIALVTWAVDAGLIALNEPETRVVVDVPSGRLEACARIEKGHATSVRFRNVPSFVLEEELPLTLDSGSVGAAIAFGGAFYAILPADAVGCSVKPGDLSRLIELGRQIKRAIEAKEEVVHPQQPELRGIYGVIFTEGNRNVTIFADGEVDRSPCGSGSSARLALMDLRGELPRGSTLTHESIIGTKFLGRVVDTAKVDGYPAVITEIEGSASLTGFHQFVLEPDDPLPDGFLLR